MEDREALTADLVLQGGGVKGIALVGAVQRFAREGYRFQRIAGTSSGAMVGALVAALERAGESIDRLREIGESLDYTRMRDRGPIAGPIAAVGLGAVVDGLAIAFEDGMFEGDYLTTWLRGVLSDLGVVTFADLRLPADEGTDLPAAHRFRLMVTASDLSRQRLVRMPWDYVDYGLDPDEQEVAGAVRASASMPFYFEPVTLRGGAGDPNGHGASTLVDGGLLAGFPIGSFDRTDGRPPRWPTFGVRLSARDRHDAPAEPVSGPVSLALHLVETMLNADDAARMDDPCNAGRSVFVDTSGVAAMDFQISAAEREQLVRLGDAAAGRFLRHWDFQTWKGHCRGGPQ